MDQARLIHAVGLVGAVVLPFWNIPLAIRIGQRRSSRDISVSWTLGVFGCLLLMLPSALVSSDSVFKVFSVVNIICFTAVVIQVMRFR